MEITKTSVVARLNGYILDTPKKTNQTKTEESTSVNTTPEWRGHSTGTAPKATGILYGATKDATLAAVKMPD